MKFLKIFVQAVFCVFSISGAHAVDIAEELNKYHFKQQSRNCGAHGACLVNGESCASGNTCIGQACKSCSELTNKLYPLSDAQSIGKDACMKRCLPIRIEENGEVVGQLEPEYTTECYESIEQDKCNYKYVYCYNETDECNGYHEENGTCVPNKQECIGDHGKGVKFWECNKDGTICDWSTECFLTQCDDTYHLEPIEIDPYGELEYGFICNDENKIYGKCVDDELSCSEKLDGCKGDIINDAVWTTDGAEIDHAPGKWDFSKCRCETAGVSIEGGIGKTSCLYKASDPWGENTIWKNGKECDVVLAETCDIGYCQPDGTTGCTKAPAGYYHDNTADFTCQPCPIGATSASGAEKINDCHMTIGNNDNATRFCDSVGCFYLEGSGIIPY